MNVYVYSNFCIEYACHTIRCQIRLHSYFYVLLVAGSCIWYLVLSLRIVKHRRATLIGRCINKYHAFYCEAQMSHICVATGTHIDFFQEKHLEISRYSLRNYATCVHLYSSIGETLYFLEIYSQRII